MKKKKNAFTLIELLAIIVILAIIAVITVPIILNIIENSRKGASIDSAYGYKDSVQQYYLSKSVGDSTSNVLATQQTKTVSELEADGLTVNGQKPSDGWVKINKGQVVDYSLKFGEYVVNYDESTKTPISTKGGEIEILESDPSWFTYSTNEDNTLTITGFSDEYKNNHSDVTDIVIPSKDGNGTKVTSIGQEAFANNLDLTSVVISNGITSIETAAFAQNSPSNSNLKNVVISDSVKTIGSSAFFNSQLENITIGNNVETIGFMAFLGTKLKELTIPDSVVTIDDQAFNNISTLKKLSIGSKVSSIGHETFHGTNISELIIPDNVKTIEEYAFGSISTLKTVSIGSGITNYKSTAFNSSNNIEILEIAMKEIPAGAFAGKRNLKNVTLTNNVSKIGAGSFSSTGIEEITIPSSVTLIENGSFHNSNSLTKVINNTGKSFNWNGIITGTSGESFETGTVTVGDRTVEITNQ